MSRSRIILDVPPVSLRAWKRAAKREGVTLSAWIRLQCGLSIAFPREYTMYESWLNNPSLKAKAERAAARKVAK